MPKPHRAVQKDPPVIGATVLLRLVHARKQGFASAQRALRIIKTADTAHIDSPLLSSFYLSRWLRYHCSAIRMLKVSWCFFRFFWKYSHTA